MVSVWGFWYFHFGNKALGAGRRSETVLKDPRAEILQSGWVLHSESGTVSSAESSSVFLKLIHLHTHHRALTAPRKRYSSPRSTVRMAAVKKLSSSVKLPKNLLVPGVIPSVPTPGILEEAPSTFDRICGSRIPVLNPFHQVPSRCHSLSKYLFNAWISLRGRRHRTGC